MENWETPLHIRAITPILIAEYLKKKPEYQKTYEIMIHEGWFTAKEIAEGLNTIRIQRIKNTEKINKQIHSIEVKENPTSQDKVKLEQLKAQKTVVMKSTMIEVFGYAITTRLKDASISYRQVYQLIGSLLHIHNPNEEVQEILQIQKEALYEAFDTQIFPLELYREEVEQSIAQLTQQYFANTAIGNSINEAEKKILGQQAFDAFKKDHESEIQNGTINISALTSYLSQKKCI